MQVPGRRDLPHDRRFVQSMLILALFGTATLTLAPSGSATRGSPQPGHDIAQRTATFAQTFEQCGGGYREIAAMLQAPAQTDAQQVSRAVARLTEFCADIGGELATANTNLFAKETLDAETAIRAYLSSLRHLATYIRTQSATELTAAQRGLVQASSQDVYVQHEINARRAIYGIAALPLTNQFLAAGPHTTI
jgi:hypothetical protein